LQAKKISHDKLKKTIYYDSAVLKIYDVPLFYFPKFFHPDPTVKRQSGFLAPLLTNTTALGVGFGYHISGQLVMIGILLLLQKFIQKKICYS